MPEPTQSHAASRLDWPEGGLPHGEHPYDYGYGEDLARNPHVHAASSDLLLAVAIAQAQSGTFEQVANEEIPQAIIERLYAKKCIASAADHMGEAYVYATERGERLLAWLLRRAAS